MNIWLEKWQELKLAISRLSPQERLLLTSGLGAFFLILLLSVGAFINLTIAREQQHIRDKGEKLWTLLNMQNSYKMHQAAHKAKIEWLQNVKVKLVSWVEDAAKRASVEIGQLRPEDGEPSKDGVIESRVDLKALGLSADKLQAFLNHLESGNNLVIVRHLKIIRPYRRETADIEMTVATYRLKS
jgi:hypothetical protein